MIIRWLDVAVNNLQSLRYYIAQDNDVAATFDWYEELAKTAAKY